MVIVLLSVLIAAGAGNEGRDEFAIGKRYFLEQRYEDALPWLERAYLLSKHRPSTILGLAQCERALGRIAEAIAHYREYLATSPPADEAAAIALTIEALETQLAATKTSTRAPPAQQQQTAVEAPRPPVAPVIESSPPPREVLVQTAPEPPLFERPVFWIITGAAVLAIGAGTALVFAARSPDPQPWPGTIGHELHR